ncbi:flagellar protein FlaG [Lysinibacillus xylanilyticus]|uniref:flagellar protein FlaG n=1 Tax=Lysinibacillus xylanilyticus TaxID=582475 RepID=UPI002B251827|nr:flagellar protein FlaG [Lysinibacillus xylanilyticus]MEB2282529.1 flagellar protein FlaG [Lysinibacillus xylanilyticus]
MRVSGDGNIDSTVNKTYATYMGKLGTVPEQGSKATSNVSTSTVEQVPPFENTEETKAKVQQAVDTMNQMLEVSHSAAKFVYHEGLERYYVTVVDQVTDEVLKEIPPKKLLDTFYEMQKMLGMIVDKKI